MRGLADKAFAAGFNVVRLNQRNCGGTEHLSRGLYHSGLTADPLFVLTRAARSRRAVALCRRRLLARRQHHDEARRRARRPRVPGGQGVRRGVAGDRARSLHAIDRAAREPDLRMEFLPQPAGADAPQGETFPGAFDLDGLWKVWSIRAFDDRYTAPHHGFNGAADYYHRASAMRVIDRVARPALILSAADDPFVPPHIFDAPAVTEQSAHHDHHHVARRPLRVRRSPPPPTAMTATSPSERSSISWARASDARLEASRSHS